MACRPYWVTRFQSLENADTRISSGVSIVTNPEDPMYGLIPQAPEILRAHAEAQLLTLGFPLPGGKLTLDQYSVARNIHSEQGSGTYEQKVCLALSTARRAWLRGQTPSQLLLTSTNRPYGFYGCSDCGAPSSLRPGKFSSTAQDPTVEDVAITIFVLDGGAGRVDDDKNFARGADNTAGPGSVTAAASWLMAKAPEKAFWVGPVPGVNPVSLLLFRTDKNEPDPQTRLNTSIKALQLQMSTKSYEPAGCVAPRPLLPLVAAVTLPAFFGALLGFAVSFWPTGREA